MRRGLMAAAVLGGFAAGSWAWIAAFAVAAWAIGVYFWPFAKCWRCKGRKVNPGSMTKRWGLCKRCKGTGSRQVIGSKQVHRAVLGMRSAAASRQNRSR